MFPTSTFIPQMKGYIRRQTGYTDTGSPLFGSATKVGLSIVRIEAMNQPTSIRTDKSGSQGRADERVVMGRFLLDNKSDPKGGNLIKVGGTEYRIVDVFPRYDMDGLINHFQVDVERWD